MIVSFLEGEAIGSMRYLFETPKLSTFCLTLSGSLHGKTSISFSVEYSFSGTAVDNCSICMFVEIQQKIIKVFF